MKPQDIVVLIGVLSAPEGWRHIDLAKMVHLSQSEVTMSLERSRIAGMMADNKRTVFRKALMEFIEHGLRYVFPARPGAIVRGVPTAYSAPPLSQTIRAHETDVLVWPSMSGSIRGQAIEPLYPSVPDAALENPTLYAMLAMTDVVRLGPARERKLALDLVHKYIFEQTDVEKPT